MKKEWLTRVECKSCHNVGVYRFKDTVSHACPVCGVSGMFYEELFRPLSSFRFRHFDGEWVRLSCPECGNPGMIYRPSRRIIVCPSCLHRYPPSIASIHIDFHAKRPIRRRNQKK